MADARIVDEGDACEPSEEAIEAARVASNGEWKPLATRRVAAAMLRAAYDVDRQA